VAELEGARRRGGVDLVAFPPAERHGANAQNPCDFRLELPKLHPAPAEMSADGARLAGNRCAAVAEGDVSGQIEAKNPITKMQ